MLTSNVEEASGLLHSLAAGDAKTDIQKRSESHKGSHPYLVLAVISLVAVVIGMFLGQSIGPLLSLAAHYPSWSIERLPRKSLTQ